MANYLLYGNGNKLFDVVSGDDGVRIADVLLYATATEFGVTNTDGSQSYYHGSGFVWDQASGQFLGGTVTRIVHFANGQYIDELNNLDYSIGGDTLYGYTYSNLFFGDDVLDARYRVNNMTLPVTLNGFAGNDTIYGGKGSDVLIGGDGNDTITGGGGNDRFEGGNDNDVMSGAAGNDKFLSGFGNDTAAGGAGVDRLYGEEGADTLRGGAGNDILYGGRGGDTLAGGADTDTAVYSFMRSELRLEKTASGFRVLATDGIDTLTGIERLAFDDGTYSLNASTGALTKINSVTGVELINPVGVVTGTAVADFIDGPDIVEPVVIRSLGGNDQISLSNTESLVFAGAGDDVVITGFTSALHRIYGEGGNDTIIALGDCLVDGGAGNDEITSLGRVFGGTGNDTISGSGAGTLWGGAGNDTLRLAPTMTGDAGADTFEFNFQTLGVPGPIFVVGWGNTTITDFQLGLDRLAVTASTTTTPSHVLTQETGGYLLTATLNSAVSTVHLVGLTTPSLTVDDLLLA